MADSSIPTQASDASQQEKAKTDLRQFLRERPDYYPPIISRELFDKHPLLVEITNEEVLSPLRKKAEAIGIPAPRLFLKLDGLNENDVMPNAAVTRVTSDKDFVDGENILYVNQSFILNKPYAVNGITFLPFTPQELMGIIEHELGHIKEGTLSPARLQQMVKAIEDNDFDTYKALVANAEHGADKVASQAPFCNGTGVAGFLDRKSFIQLMEIKERAAADNTTSHDTAGLHPSNISRAQISIQTTAEDSGCSVTPPAKSASQPRQRL